MALQNDEHSSDKIHSLTHIWNHIFSFINSMTLKCAIELKIPDIIHSHGEPMTLSELVEALPIHKNKSIFVYRLMRILVHSGFFLKQIVHTTGVDGEEQEGYLLTPASQLLLTQQRLNVRSFLLAMLDPILMDPWQNMSEWFQNDDVNPFVTAHGKTLWDYAGELPEFNQLFNEGMGGDATLVTSVILEKCSDVFGGLNSIVDVGGGIGIVGKAIAEAFPNIKYNVFDIPHVVDGLEGIKNLSYVGGDMFEAIPKADAVLLKSILHDWNDEECLKILKQCKEAIPSKENGGKLIIIDIVLKEDEDDEKSLETQLFFDMLMMVLVNGKERSKKEWEKLFRDAGFSNYKITPVLGCRSLIEVYP